MELLIVGGLLVWFISTIPGTFRRSAASRKAEEQENAAASREDAYFADLIAKADAGDQEAVKRLRWFGYKMRPEWDVRLGF